VRRRAGAVYTPPEHVLQMIDWVFVHKPSRLVDAAVAYKRSLNELQLV